MSKQDFIEQITPFALDVQRKYGIPASLVIAQAALESGWGTAAKGNNYFGIKADKRWDGSAINFATHEVENHKIISAYANFRAYGSMADSVANYGKFIAENKRYANVFNASDGYEAAEAIDKAGYATGVGYAKLVKDIIRDNNLTRFDDKKFENYSEKEGVFAGFIKMMITVVATLLGADGKKLFATSAADHTTISAPHFPAKKAAAAQLS